MGFWSSVDSCFKKAANWAGKTAKSIAKSTWDFVSSPIKSIRELATKAKRLVSSLTEWKDNAWNLLKQRYPGWLVASIFTAGILLFKFSAIFVIPAVLTG